jgi:hypothetical protein
MTYFSLLILLILTFQNVQNNEMIVKYYVEMKC